MHTAHVGLRSEASGPQLSPQQPNLLKLASSSCGKNVASPCPWSGAPPLACLLFLGRCFLPVQIHVVDFSLRRQTLHPPNPPLLSQPRSTHIVGISQLTRRHLVNSLMSSSLAAAPPPHGEPSEAENASPNKRSNSTANDDADCNNINNNMADLFLVWLYSLVIEC